MSDGKFGRPRKSIASEFLSAKKDKPGDEDKNSIFLNNPNFKLPDFSETTLAEIEVAKKLIEGGNGKQGITKLSSLQSNLAQEVERLTRDKGKLTINISTLRDQQEGLIEKVSSLEEQRINLSTVTGKILNQTRAIAIAVSLLIGAPVSYGVYKLGDWIWVNPEEQAEMDTRSKQISKEVTQTLKAIGMIQIDTAFEIEGTMFDRTNKTLAFGEREFIDSNSLYGFGAQYKGYQIEIAVPFRDPENIVIDFAGEKIEMMSPSLEELTTYLQNTYKRREQDLRLDDEKKSRELREKQKQEAEALVLAEKKSQEDKNIVLSRKEAIRQVMTRLSGNPDIQIGDSFEFVTSNGEHSITFSLSTDKGNGGLLDDSYWLNSNSRFTITGDAMKSNTLSMVSMKKFKFDIDLQEPYNIQYTIKNNRNSKANSKVGKGYSSENLFQLQSDIFDYFSQGAKVK